LVYDQRWDTTDNQSINFLSDISRIRNQYIHNIKNLGEDLLVISKKANIRNFQKFSKNDKLRLLIWVRSVVILSLLFKHINKEEIKVEMHEMERYMGKLKLDETKRNAK
jgi:hypothetical protein